MQSPLSPRNWIIFILVNLLVSAITAFIVVRALTQGAARPDAAVLAAPVATQSAASTPAFIQSPVAISTQSPTLEATALPLVQAAIQPTESSPSLVSPEEQSPTVPTASAPTAQAEANVRISTIVYPGQRTREAVVIVNEGDQADMTGWTLSNPRGSTYTFGSVLLFKDSFINLHTSTGVDVPTDLFWNLEDAVWQSGDVATLKRGDEVMATFTVK
jgi:hypothetical protein